MIFDDFIWFHISFDYFIWFFDAHVQQPQDLEAHGPISLSLLLSVTATFIPHLYASQEEATEAYWRPIEGLIEGLLAYWRPFEGLMLSKNGYQ